MARRTTRALDPGDEPSSGDEPSTGSEGEGRDSATQDRVARALRAAAEGDEVAWRVVIDHYAPRVFGLLRAQCGDGELAEEIAQSTFCTVASRIATYVEEGKFESWLFRIAINRLRDEQRRRARHAAPTEHAALDLAPGGARGSGEGGADGIEEDSRSALHAALARLAPADQRVVHLRHCGGLSFKQIAEAVDEPLGTVLARHHRALRKLRDLLGGAESSH